MAGGIFERENCERFVVFLGEPLLHGHRRAADLDLGAVGQIAQGRHAREPRGIELVAVGIERVAAHVEPEQLFLVREFFFLGARGRVGPRVTPGPDLAEIEQRGLTAGPIPLHGSG